ncbi:MAG: site-specific integrase [Hadesarchaea archaeon]|nr:site-specific integrase [Hadesarchaea archaeon]
MKNPENPDLEKKSKMKSEWLNQFGNENTKRQYEISLKQFEDFLSVSVNEYIKGLEWEDFWRDLQEFWESLSDKAPKTQNNRVRVVKLFFQDHGVEIPDSEWSKFRRRKMKASRPQTQDRAGKKSEWRRIILNMASPQGRALYLTLLSTGARVGEILQIHVDDVDFDSDPARIRLRAEYTKGGVGDRVVFLTHEAEAALRNYLEWRKGKKSASGKKYDRTSRVFPFTQQTAREMLYNALDRAGLDSRDRSTGRREIHTHSTRKFFRSNCRLGEALTHAIMGHQEYLDSSYLRIDPDRAAREFKKNMNNLQITTKS